jgi:hypothetical protein
MGMYTECILGCSLKENTPTDIIDALQFMVLPMDECPGRNIPEGIKLPPGERIDWLFRSGGSFCFGGHSGVIDFTFDKYSKEYRLTARFNIKNYDNEIEHLLEWLHPWIRQGSGIRDFYAAVTYEEADKPTIYYLKDKDGNETTFPCNE